MAVIKNWQLPVYEIPGIEHRTVAGRDQDVHTMEVWKQTLAPGVATPVHMHACEEVIVILEGAGEIILEGERTSFGADSTLVVPPEAVHQVINSGTEPIRLIAVLGMSPVRVRTAKGERIPLPWDAVKP